MLVKQLNALFQERSAEKKGGLHEAMGKNPDEPLSTAEIQEWLKSHNTPHDKAMAVEALNFRKAKVPPTPPSPHRQPHAE